MIEVGIPFSDPVADGPVIQAAAQRALDAGVRVADCFDLIAGFRARHPDVPVGILTYANIVVARGPGFMRDAAEAGADSLLIADVPALEAEPFTREMAQAGHRAGADRRRQHARRRRCARIARLSKAYTYCVSRAGITGTHAGGAVRRGPDRPPQAGRRPAADFRLRHFRARARPRRARGGRERRDLRLGDRRSCRAAAATSRLFVRSLKDCDTERLAAAMIESLRTRRRQHGRAADLARADPARLGLDPGRDLSRRPRAARRSPFHQVHEPSGKRIKYEKVVPGIGPVDRDEIVKGYEVSKGHYVLLDPEEIESVKLESRKTLDLTQFVDARRHRPDLFRQALLSSCPPTTSPRKPSSCCARRCKAAKKVGIGQLAMRGQEYVVA